MKRSGLATWMKCAALYREKGESPIYALLRVNHASPWHPFRPSEHIKKLCCRALRGKVGATFEDWNRIVELALGREGISDNNGVRKACIQLEVGLIVAWGVSSKMPWSARFAATFDYPPLPITRSWTNKWIPACDLCGEQKESVESRDDLRGWRAERNKQGGIKRGQPRHLRYGHVLCAECAQYIRKSMNEVARAQSELDALNTQVSAINKAVKEMKNATQ